MTFQKKFQGKRAYLGQNLDCESNHFMLELEDRNVITLEQSRDIKSLRTLDDKNARLLEILTRRPDEKFSEFCEALIESGQSHIVKNCFKEHLMTRNDTPMQSI
jgi:hypothetical protein